MRRQYVLRSHDWVQKLPFCCKALTNTGLAICVFPGSSVRIILRLSGEPCQDENLLLILAQIQFFKVA